MAKAFSILFYSIITFASCYMAQKIKKRPRYADAGKKPIYDNGDNNKAGIIYNNYNQYRQHNNGGYHDRRRAYNNTLLAALFFLLFAVSALRFGIGNDYKQYTMTAHEAYVGGYVVTESGFNLLVRGVYTLLGTEAYELVFALLAFVTLILFISAMYRLSDSFSISFFMFMTLGFYFQTFNTVRYYLALAAAFYSIRYIFEGNRTKFILLILAASLFHKSVLVVIPVYLVASVEWKRYHIIIGMIISAVCWILRPAVLRLALMLYPSYRDTIYLDAHFNITSVIRLAFVMGLYVWFVMYRGKDSISGEAYYPRLRFYGQLGMIALAVETFFYYLPVVTRLVYYFGISQLLMVPLIIVNIEDKKVKKRAGLVVFFACAAYFAVFMANADSPGVGLLPYRSLLWENERYYYK